MREATNEEESREIWGKGRCGNIELFSIALLLNTDIWVSITEMKIVGWCILGKAVV